MAKDWKFYALHTLECIEKINIIIKQGDISDNFILYDATLRNLQTLSEATMHLPKDLKQQYNNVNWKGITGFRNILVHNYLGEIDPETVKKIINDHLPELDKIVKAILST